MFTLTQGNLYNMGLPVGTVGLCQGFARRSSPLRGDAFGALLIPKPDRFASKSKPEAKE